MICCWSEWSCPHDCSLFLNREHFGLGLMVIGNKITIDHRSLDQYKSWLLLVDRKHPWWNRQTIRHHPWESQIIQTPYIYPDRISSNQRLSMMTTWKRIHASAWRIRITPIPELVIVIIAGVPSIACTYISTWRRSPMQDIDRLLIFSTSAQLVLHNGRC